MEVQAPAVEPMDKPIDSTAPAPVLETTKTDAPKVEEVTKTEYELPDGTKTDATGLSKAWRDNFMPEFTRRSQELAALKKQEAPKENVPVELPWKQDKAWDAKTYDDLAEPLLAAAEQRVWAKIVEESGREERERAQRETYISQEVEQLKGIDPKVNVPSVMAHASKYQFPSLIPAYQNMKAIEDAEKRVEERVLKNMKQRAAEPVGTGSADPGAGVSFPPGVRTGYDKAKWILNNQK